MPTIASTTPPPPPNDPVVPVQLNHSDAINLLHAIDRGDVPWNLLAAGAPNVFTVFLDGLETPHCITLERDGTWNLRTQVTV